MTCQKGIYLYYLDIKSVLSLKTARSHTRTSTRALKVQGALFIAHSIALFYITLLYVIKKLLLFTIAKAISV